MIHAADHVLPIDEAMTDPMLFGSALGAMESWSTWRVILKAAFGLPLDDDERAIFATVAGSREPPKDRVAELWVIAGRRGGKSRMAGLVSAHLAAFNTHRLAPGETASVVALAVSKDQAKTVLDYATAFLQGSPVLRQEIEGEPTTEAVRLRGNITITVAPANFRTVRSRTLIGAVFDETAFWRDAETSSNPDAEIYTAALPSLATARGMLVGISSPYRRAGLLFKKWQAAFGKDDPNVLVVVAPSRVLNPTIEAGLVERAREMDPDAARSEWDAEFRSDISDFLSRDAVMDCVDRGVRERAPDRSRIYTAFTDPAGGAGTDSFALGIAHKEGVTSVLDAVREVRPPFNPEGTVAEFAALLKTYRVSSVQGDKYAGEWPASQFRKHGIGYVAADRPKSDIYRDVLPLINSGAAALIEHDRMVSQLAALERRTARGGRDSIDHPPGGNDDVANVVAGVLVRASLGLAGPVIEPQFRTTAPPRSPFDDIDEVPMPRDRRSARPVPPADPLHDF